MLCALLSTAGFCPHRYAAFKERYPTAEPVAGRPADPSQPCGEVLPTLVNVLDRFPANGKEEYAFQVEPFAPIVTFAKVGTC